MIRNWIGDRLGDLLQGAIEAAIGFILWILDLIWTMIQGLTNPDLGADFVRLWAGRIFYISLPLLFIFFIAQVLLAATKGSMQQMSKAALGVMIGVVGTFFSVPLVAYLTRGADTLADGLIGVAMTDVAGGFAEPLFGDATGEDIYATFASTISTAGASPFATAAVVGAFTGIFWLIVVLGAIALFFALLIRTNLLYVMVVIGPIMLAGLPWKATHTWARRWFAIVIALVFTKFGVVIVMAVGAGMLTSPITVSVTGADESTTATLGLMGNFIGAGIMLTVAALTPVATFKFFDFLGENSVAALHAGARGPVDTGKQMVMNRLHPGMLKGHTKPPASIPTTSTTTEDATNDTGADTDSAKTSVTRNHPLPPQPPTGPNHTGDSRRCPGCGTNTCTCGGASNVPQGPASPVDTTSGGTSTRHGSTPTPTPAANFGAPGEGQGVGADGNSPNAGVGGPMWDQAPRYPVEKEPVVTVAISDHDERAAGPLPVHSADQPPPTPPPRPAQEE